MTMSKAEQIIDLLATTGLTRKQIADRAGCLPAYVRVVEQRLAGNDAGKRWRCRNPDALRARNERRKQKYHSDPEFRERTKEIDRRAKRRAQAKRQQSAHA